VAYKVAGVCGGRVELVRVGPLCGLWRTRSSACAVVVWNLYVWDRRVVCGVQGRRRL